MIKNKSTQTASMVVATNVGQTVDGFKKKSAPLFKVVENFTIESKADQEKLVKVLKQIKAYGKEAEAQQAAFVDPAKAIIAQSKTFFKPFLDSVDEAQALGKEKILTFVNGRLLASETVSECFKQGKISKLSTVVSRQAELEDNDNTRKVWVLHIKLGEVPRKYLIPDEARIRKDLTAGKKIAGCRLKQKTIIAI